MDLVIPLVSQKDTDNSELRYLLRSAEKHFQNLGNIVLIGYKPKWFTNGLHMDASDPFKHGNKDANIILKLEDAVKWKEVSDPFVWSADDGVFLQDWTEEDMLLPEGRPWKLNEPPETPQGDRQNIWEIRKTNTRQYLHGQLGCDPLYYDMHCPQPVASDFSEIMRRTPFTKTPGLLVTSTYMNLSKAFAHPVNGRVRRPVIKYPLPEIEFDIMAMHYKFMTHSSSGFSNGMRKWLEKRYNGKSSYELY